ncbi:hypothetical protein [Halalkalicoccus subterraneus]|uniref:hypothetical protein n=1 Tax=Halalkalicoccus subterraneus TaxID=2675002 RepID=UPI000EFD5CA2|nr:hypothetical protein [Halalkalicoccus subterraneus]
MYSHEHAAIGALCGALSVPVVARGRSPPAKLALWTYGLFLSVFVDLDHFLIARVKTGGWSHLVGAVHDPVRAFTDQESVFPDVTIRLERLASHVLIGGALVRLLRPVSRPLARVSAVNLAAHVLADVLRELELA